MKILTLMNGMEENLMGTKICKRCGKSIRKEEKQVLLKTFDKKKIYEELYWHLTCWAIDFDEKAAKKAMQMYSSSMKVSMETLDKIFKGTNNGKEKETNQSILLQQGVS